MTMNDFAIVEQSCLLADITTPEELWHGLIEQRIFPKDVTISIDTKSKKEGLDDLFCWLEYCSLPLLSSLKKSKKIGVVLGNLAYPSKKMNQYSMSQWYPNLFTKKTINPLNRFNSGYPSQWLAERFFFKGPTLCIDAACSSTLYAIKLACDLLASDVCDAVVTGGINAVDGAFLHEGFKALNAISKSNRSIPFSSEADGLIPARGVGLFVVKPMHKVKAEDKILGIIKGMGFNNDGRSGGILSPSKETQVEAIKQAYESHHILPNSIDFLECHATSTPIGDVCEIESIKEVFKGSLSIGAIKSNVGHLLAASGAIGIVKILKGIEHKTIPPSISINYLRNEIEDSNLNYTDSIKPWETENHRRAAINAFGFGGNNAHIIIEEPSSIKHQVLLPQQKNKVENEDIALVAVSLKHGNIDETEDFFKPDNQLKELNISQITIDISKRYFPPRDVDEINPQQLILLPLVEEIIEQLGQPLPINTSVIIGMSTDPDVCLNVLRTPTATFNKSFSTPEISDKLSSTRVLGCMPNVPANRINTIFNIKSPSFSVCAEDKSGNQALSIAISFLNQKKCDLALVGAVDFSQNFVHLNATSASDKLNKKNQSDGAIILALKRYSDALANNDSIIASIKTTTTQNPLNNKSARIEKDKPYPYAAKNLFELVHLYKELLNKDIYNKWTNINLSSIYNADDYHLMIKALKHPTFNTPKIAKPLKISIKKFTPKKEPMNILPNPPRLRSILKTHEEQFESKHYKKNKCLFNKNQIKQHAHGKISDIFGESFKSLDDLPIRVRMPEEPFLLTDRILSIQAEPLSMKTGSIVTETDIINNAWYLHNDRMPAGITIESGQSDLLLVSYLGVDFEQKGKKAYRLLGCEATFYQDLPKVGETLTFKINIDGHAKLGSTRLFFFHYDCFVGGKLLLRIRNGKAGFFSEKELKESSGVVWNPEKEKITNNKITCISQKFLRERSFDKKKIDLLRKNDGFKCFGEGYEKLATHKRSPAIASKKLFLIDEVLKFDPHGGAWKLGYLKARRKIDKNDWFFKGHFKYDPCMPGTLMTEMCYQSLGFYLIACGLTLDKDYWRFTPTKDKKSTLLCRGQVTPKSNHLILEVFIKSIFLDDNRLEIMADVLMTVDNLKALHASNLSLSLVADYPGSLIKTTPKKVAEFNGITCDEKQIQESISGKPSNSWGKKFSYFDKGRRIARLPSDPYRCLSRITVIEGAYCSLEEGSKIISEWDIPEKIPVLSHKGELPLCLFQEALLQPCGWLASYMGCPLKTSDELFFRNLDGDLTLVSPWPNKGTIKIEAKNISITSLGKTILVNFTVRAFDQKNNIIADLKTSFGYFTYETLKDQKGLCLRKGEQDIALFSKNQPAKKITALKNKGVSDFVDSLQYKTNEEDLLVKAIKVIDPYHWVLKSHFFQDPVIPGSFGIETAFQAFKLSLKEIDKDMTFKKIKWKYRGQITPKNKEMVLVGSINSKNFKAESSLYIDSTKIYEIDFS